ncbi:hypothetical protein [Sinorhizobium fredii]|uniref:hypothetical protein n=1 Tax=Rhizobium fredii TaxID=380 RepID=UPI00351567EA
MGEKRRKVYEALVDGATHGYSDKNLYDFVLKRCPKTSSKKLVRASLLALTDPDLKDRNVLATIYALAIKHRLDEVRIDEIDLEEDEDMSEPAPLVSGNRPAQQLSDQDIPA